MQQEVKARKRLVDSKAWKLAMLLLALLWVAAMSAVDGHASSFMPAGWVLVAVLGVVVLGVAMGYKVVRMSLSGWFCLGVGVYYAVCSMLSSSLVEGWVDSGLIFGGFVFFLAGVYAGQVNGSGGVAAVLCLAVLANFAGMWLCNATDLSLCWVGRPDISLCGANTRNTTLFIYKNFAGLFFMLSGMLLVWRVVWERAYTVRGLLSLAVGVAAVVGSFFCRTRVVWLALPLLLGLGIMLWIMLRVMNKQRVGTCLAVAGALIAVAVLVFFADLFLGHSLLDMLLGVDTHLRFLIWGDALRAASEAPLHGFGAAATQWVIAPEYGEWELPNYAHNDYLQAWVDYGFVGVVLMFGTVLLLVVQGVRALMSEHVAAERRCKVALALLCVVCVAAAAFTDFVWHSFALVGMTAFAAGVLASPFPQAPWRLFDFRNWAPGSRPGVRPLRAQAGLGKCLLLLLLATLCYGVGAQCCKLYKGWAAQWEYHSLVKQGAPSAEQSAFLLNAVPDYPDTRILDYYVLSATGELDWPAFERSLRCALQNNPRQIFTATMLADVLQRQGRFAEAEQVYRRYYPGDGPKNCLQNCWATYYATNLYRWAQQSMSQGNAPRALSLFTYAERIFQSGTALHPSLPYRSGKHTWVDGGTPERKRFFAHCKLDAATLRAVGIAPDDSWTAPMEQNGKPALYRRFQNDGK